MYASLRSIQNQMQALPKARLKPEGERAAEMTAAEKVRSGQRIQGAMRQQPCAPNTGQPQQLAATIVEAPTTTCRGLMVAERQLLQHCMNRTL